MIMAGNTFNIPDRVYRDIVAFARKADISKIILFGSRARRTNHERSDIDLAVSGGRFQDFYWDIQEKTHSLLSFDLIEMDRGVSGELLEEINRDGVVIYEKD